MLKEYLVSLVIFFAIVFTALLIRKLAVSMLGRWAKKTETRIDNIILETIRHPSIYWSVAIGLYIAIAVSSLPPKVVDYSLKAIYVIIIFSMTIASANLTGKIFKYYIEKTDIPIPTTGLAHGLIKGTIITVGFLIMLGSIGVSVTPLITALGVGGLAVALALQDTLSNLFAGIHILMEKSLRIGDFIKLETGQEGFVEDIGWRTSKVTMLPNNMVIIPNSRLAQSIVTNYYLPEKRMSLRVPVGVSYSSDPERVEKILVEEAKKAVGEVAGLLGDPEPFVRFIPGFGESSLDFTLICQVKEFVDQYLVQHELRKRIFKRFKEEGIEIPFPHRTVYLREEKEWKG